jgi:hypothetical protein
MDDFVWLAHPETGNKAQFSAESAEIWRKRGWEDTDPPAPVDPTTAHLVQAQPAPAEQPAVDDTPPPADESSTPKTSRRSSGNSAEKEQA